MQDEIDRLRRALEFYARGCNVTRTIEAAERGDIDMARAVENFNEDAGDVARMALARYEPLDDKPEDD